VADEEQERRRKGRKEGTKGLKIMDKKGGDKY
jgi:hypothetical protein